MEIRQLQHFLAVKKYGGFSKAAQELNMTQPGLTKSIRRLENRLGVRLFVRGSRQVKLTDYGELLEPHAINVDIEMNEALEELKARRDNRTGDVLVGAGPMWANRYLPEAVVKLHDLKPRIKFKISFGEPDELMEMLKLGMLDVVFAGFLAIEDGSLDTIPLIIGKEGVVLRPGHPLTKKQPCSVADVLEYGWIFFSKENRKRNNFESSLTDLGFTPPRPVIETESLSQVLNIVENTDLLTLLPNEILDQRRDGGRLTFLDCPDLTRNRQAGAILRSRGGGSATTRALIKEVRAVCEQFGHTSISNH